VADNPFSGPFAGAPGIGGNPLDDKNNAKICCPKCGSDKFRAWTNQYGLMRKCLVPTCRETWSGGTMAAGRMDFLNQFPQPPPGLPAPDDDQPAIQYTGAAFRDPIKNLGGDE
jgi:hypothetical protein